MMEMSTSESQPLFSHYTNNSNNNYNSTLLSQSLMAAQQMMMSASSVADEQQPTQQYSTVQPSSIADQQQPHIPTTTTAPTSAVSSLSGGGVSPSYNNNSSLVSSVQVATSAATTTKRIPLPSTTSQSMPTSIFLLKNPLGLGGSNESDDDEDDTPPTHPVPEFLCHLYTMVNDKSLDHLISWEVPKQDSKYGMKGVGNVVVHDPPALQDILGRYYRHSSYPSFQRQLNYFGFKKRLLTKKKGKMSPCAYVHESLGKRPSSMLKLKRRQATKKDRNLGSAAIVSATSTSGTSSTTRRTTKLSKKRPKPLIMIPPRPRGLVKTIPATAAPLNDCAFNAGSVVNSAPEAKNDTIIEARKLLEQNFLKEFSLVKKHVPLLQPQDQELYQQQIMAAVLPFQEQPQAITAQQLQQKQNEQMLTLLSNHSSAVAMSDDGQLLNHSSTLTDQSNPLWLPANTMYNPSVVPNVPQAQFPSLGLEAAAAHTVSTNYLMGEVNTTN